MGKQILPTPEQLREVLRYEPETGKLFWKQRPVEMFNGSSLRTSQHACAQWNAKLAGKEAFTANNGSGYKVGKFQGHTLRAHRVAWAIHYGEWPEDELDHENLIRDDNRISNLRIASSTQNKWNQGSRSTNVSGYKGACWFKRDKCWVAQISVNGKSKKIGYFKTAEEAHEAYKSEAFRLRGEYARIY